jgi:hypothetical protein
MSNERVDRLRRLLEALDLDDAHPDARTYPPPQWPGESVYHGRTGAKTLVSEWTGNFDEYRWEVDRMIDGEEYVVALCHHRGRIKDQGGLVSEPVAAIYDEFDGVRPKRIRLFFSWEEALEVVGLRE